MAKYDWSKRASKKEMRRVRKFWRDEWWNEFGYATQFDRWCAKHRAKLTTTQRIKAFGSIDYSDA